MTIDWTKPLCTIQTKNDCVLLHTFGHGVFRRLVLNRVFDQTFRVSEMGYVEDLPGKYLENGPEVRYTYQNVHEDFVDDQVYVCKEAALPDRKLDYSGMLIRKYEDNVLIETKFEPSEET